MKKITKKIAAVGFGLMGLFLTSCDPCSGVLCTNGECSNGTCICITGYEKQDNACIGHNEAYAGDYTITQLFVDSAGTSTSTDAQMTLEADSTVSSTLGLVIKNFNATSDNDIKVSISATNADILTIANQTTGAGITYSGTGSRVGSKISLEINSGNDTYTVSTK